jgi:hypothetical protein
MGALRVLHAGGSALGLSVTDAYGQSLQPVMKGNLARTEAFPRNVRYADHDFKTRFPGTIAFRSR